MKLLMHGDPLASVPERSFIYVCEEWGGVGDTGKAVKGEVKGSLSTSCTSFLPIFEPCSAQAVGLKQLQLQFLALPE